MVRKDDWYDFNFLKFSEAYFVASLFVLGNVSCILEKKRMYILLLSDETFSLYVYVFVCVLVAESCPTLCGCVDCSPPGSSVYGFSRQEYWSGLPCPPPGYLPNPGIEPRSPKLQERPRKAVYIYIIQNRH